MLIKKGYFRVSIFLTALILIMILISTNSSAVYVTTKLPLENSISDFHNNKIVYSYKTSEENFDVFLYDLSAQEKIQITNIPGNQVNAQYFGDKIVWSDDRNTNDKYPINYDIYMYNLTTNQEFQITFDTSYQRNIDFKNNIIVWEDFRNNNVNDSYDTFDIYMYDILEGVEKPICTNRHNQRNPKIFGDKIIWIDNRNSYVGYPFQFYIYDLSKNQEERINLNMTLNVSEFYYSSDYLIINNKIIWRNYEYNGSDFLRADYQIFSFDIETQELTQITNDTYKSIKTRLTYFDNTIIWLEAPYIFDNSNQTEFSIISYDLLAGTKNIIGKVESTILNIYSDTNGNLVWSRMGYIEGTNETERYYEVFYYFWSDDPSDAIDTDSDEMVDIYDYDDDNDGYNDTVEISEGSEPLDPQSTPLDNDKDFIPDSIDDDDDNDGVPDDQDNHPLDEYNGKSKSTKEEDYTPMIISAVIIIVILIIVGFIKKVRKKK